MRRITVIDAAEAAGLVRDGQSLVTSGHIGAGFPEALAEVLAERHGRGGHPDHLTLVHAAGQRDFRDRGLGVLRGSG